MFKMHQALLDHNIHPDVIHNYHRDLIKTSQDRSAKIATSEHYSKLARKHQKLTARLARNIAADSFIDYDTHKKNHYDDGGGSHTMDSYHHNDIKSHDKDLLTYHYMKQR